MRQQSILNRVLGLGLILLFAMAAVAQTPLGKIAGVVHDPTGAVIGGATITATNDATNQIVKTKSGNEGGFVLPQLPVGSYTIRVEATGFRTSEYKQVKVDPGQEYSLTAILPVGQTTEVVEVTAGADLVNTTSSEIAGTVSGKQMEALPLNGRNPLQLINLQAGVVGIPTRTNSAVNGGRPSWTATTQDGINIQDNYIRTNAVDFVPNRPTSDIIGEFTITTNNQGTDVSGGASQVKLITPSGTNVLHGGVYEYNRNSFLGANRWFNNHAVPVVKKPFLNRNQFGAKIGGPVLKNKLFFFGYYEGYRQATQASQTARVPMNADYFQGVYRYKDSNGTLRSINVLQLANGGAGSTLDPTVKKVVLDPFNQIFTQAYNTTTVGDGRNIAGYQFNQGIHNNRNQWGVRGDYEINSAHHLEFTHTYSKSRDYRSDIDFTNPIAEAYNDSKANLWVGAWRWLINPKLQNEFRVGANLTEVPFVNPQKYASGYLFSIGTSSIDTLASLGVTSPLVTFQPQGRNTRTRDFKDNAVYVTGNHNFQFGFALEQVRVYTYSNFGLVPTVTLDTSYLPANMALVSTQAPGISSSDLSSANALLAFLTGSGSSYSQTFEVTKQGGGYEAGKFNARNYSMDDYSAYFQDSWRLLPNFTLHAGVKWEYFTPLREDNNLDLAPVLGSHASMKDAILDPTTSIDYVKGGFWKPRKHNFGPAVGFAWDPFKDGKTSIRGGYTLAYVNEDTFRVGGNAIESNQGLEAGVVQNGYFQLTAGLPTLTPGAVKVPRTMADQIALSPTSSVFTVNPNLKQPYVHELSFGIQRELPKDLSLEVRYVGTMGKQIYRGVDFNQQNSGINQAYIADFLRARNNGFLALAANGTFNPAYNAAIAGSQPLTVISTVGQNGNLSNSTVRTYIQNGELASLADWYVARRSTYPGSPALFLPNPAIYVADLITNGTWTNYNGLQTEVRRRFKGGMFGQMNYTWSKALATSSGTGQTRFEPMLDNARPELEKSRAEFDVKHNINGNLVYELPFGKGKRWFNVAGPADKVIGGWSMSSIVHWQSGSPISIVSARGTFNRPGRSGNNTAVSLVGSTDDIKKYIGLYFLNNNPYWINPAVINPADGRAVPASDTLNYTPSTSWKQIFANPGPGQLGAMQRLIFDGPGSLGWDFSVSKKTNINERFNTEFQAAFFNFPNHPSFYVGDQNINSTSFGKISSVNVSSRVVQLGLRLNF